MCRSTASHRAAKHDNQDSRSVPQGRRGIQERQVRQLRGERPGAQGVVRQEQG